MHQRHAGQQHADGRGGRLASVGLAGGSRCSEVRRARLVLLQVRLDAGDDALELDQLPAGERRRIGDHQVGQLPAQAALAVHQADGLAQLVVGDVDAEARLQVLLELAHFVHPMSSASGSLGLLRQFEHIHRLGAPSSSNIFFLPSQVVSATTRSAQFRNGILAGDVVAEGGLDERAEVGGQELFGGWDGGGRAAAQADRHAAGRQDDLARRELAHDAHDRPALRLGGLRRSRSNDQSCRRTRSSGSGCSPHPARDSGEMSSAIVQGSRKLRVGVSERKTRRRLAAWELKALLAGFCHYNLRTSPE